jgi:hypothetical protein
VKKYKVLIVLCLLFFVFGCEKEEKIPVKVFFLDSLDGNHVSVDYQIINVEKNKEVESGSGAGFRIDLPEGSYNIVCKGNGWSDSYTIISDRYGASLKKNIILNVVAINFKLKEVSGVEDLDGFESVSISIPGETGLVEVLYSEEIEFAGVLKPGDYLLKINLVDLTGKKSVFEKSFRVEAGISKPVFF